MYQLYGHQNSGAAAIEAALELCEIPYRFIDVEASPEAAQALDAAVQAQQPGADAGGNAGAKSEDVVDAEFTEVKVEKK